MFALLNSYDVACEALNCYLDLAAAVERIDPHALLITDQASIEARALFLQQLQRSRLTLPAEAELLVSDLHAEVENVRTGRSDGSLLQHVLTEKVLAGSSKEQLGYDAVYLAAMSEAAEEQRNHVQQMFYDILSRAVAELMPTGGEIVLVPEYAAHVGVNRPPAPPAATAAAGAPVGTPPKSSAATTAAAGPAKSASPAPAAVSAAPVVKAAAAAPGAPVSSPAPAPAPAPAAAAVVAAATGAVPGAPQAGLAAKYTMAAPPPPSAPPAPPVIVPDFIAIVTDPKATVEAKMAAVAAAAEGLLTAAPPPPVPKGAALVPPPLTQAQQTVLDAFSVADNVRNVMRVVNSDADLAVRQMLLGTLVHAARMDPDIPAALVSCPEALSAAVCRLNLPTDKHVIRKGCLDLLAAVAAAANGAPAAIVSCDAVPALVSLVAAVVVEKVAAGGAPATLSPAAKTPVKTQAGRAAAADAAAASLSPAGRRTVVRAAAPTERSAITPAERHEYQEPALGLLLLLAGAGQVPALQQAGGLVAASLVLADATASGKAHVAAAQLLKALLTDVFASVAAVKAGALAGLAARSASKEAEEAAAVHTALGAVLQPPSLPPGSRLSVAHAEIGKAVRGCGPLMQLLADVPAGPLQDLLLQLLVHAVGLPENRRSVCEHEQGLGVLLGVAAVQTEALSEPGPPVAVLLRLLESEELKVPLAKGVSHAANRGRQCGGVRMVVALVFQSTGHPSS